MTKKAIQFLLKQLATNEQERDNLNLILPDKLRCHLSLDDNKSVEFGNAYNSSQPFEELEEIYQEKIIRTCLSLVNGEVIIIKWRIKSVSYISNDLYEAFDYPIRKGKTLDEAIQALHDKMLELVPEYQEFIKNNK